jgi:hypothetical protein
MKLLINSFLFLFILILTKCADEESTSEGTNSGNSSGSSEDSENGCGEGVNMKICTVGQGTCIGDPPATCLCDDPYDTYPENNQTMCNYTKKSQLIAFFLELIVTFGAGHFYTLNLKYAIPKVLFWFMGYFFFITLRVINKKKEENHPTTLLVALGGLISCCGMVIWQLVDIFMFALNKYSDGHGIDLKEW